MHTDQLMTCTRRLLDAVARADWETYCELSAQDMTCYEPETGGELIHGRDFHKQFFDSGGHMGKHASKVEEPYVRMIAEDAALVCCRRVVTGEAGTKTFLESRIWERAGGLWRQVHFHRTPL